jgi:hypothetical protein
MSPFFPFFKEVMREELLKRNWTQSDLAELWGKQPGRLSSILKARDNKRNDENHIEPPQPSPTDTTHAATSTATSPSFKKSEGWFLVDIHAKCKTEIEEF